MNIIAVPSPQSQYYLTTTKTRTVSAQTILAAGTVLQARTGFCTDHQVSARQMTC